MTPGPDRPRWNNEQKVTYRLLFLIGERKHNEKMELLSKPPNVLFEAARSGNADILLRLLESNRELLTILDPERRSLLHIIVLYRQAHLLFLLKHEMWKDLVMQMVDVHGNNVLHMAGMKSPQERFESSRSDIQMQGELLWFKVHPILFYSATNLFFFLLFSSH